MSWSGMMQAAARAGVAPDGFWRLSLKEWRMLVEAPAQAGPMVRGEFERLAAAWADGPSTASRSPSPSSDREEGG